MAKYSKSHERDENRLMNKALTRTLLALIPLPVISLALAIGGFFRMCVRVTEAHRVKRALLSMLSIIVLVAVLGAHVWAIYAYAKDPTILDNGVRAVWKAVTGQEEPPWMAAPSVDYFDYNYMDDPYADTGDEYYSPDSEAGLSTDVDDEYEEDFDDSELSGFEEDDSVDMAERDLFDQMLAEKDSGSLPLLP